MPTHDFLLFARDQLPMTATLSLPEGEARCPLVVFVHGFKGFKDWGHFPMMAQRLAAAGCAVLRFNFSHNGTTPDAPHDFADLAAFGRNTYTRELEDLTDVLDQVPNLPNAERFELSQLVLWGHSRGGGIVLLKAAADARVRGVITWAGVADLAGRVLNADQATWRRNGVQFTRNARTGQEMPLNVSLLDDVLQNGPALDVTAATERLTIPQLLLHGDADQAVQLREAHELHNRRPAAAFHLLPGADHTFGGKHPWTVHDLPAHSETALQLMLDFMKRLPSGH